MVYELIIPAFVAGVLTFLAPCTLPLVPGYLGFISGVSLKDLVDSKRSRSLRVKIFFNGIGYVLGFSIVFVALGALIAAGGAHFFHERFVLLRLGGIFVIFFGLEMMGFAKLPRISVRGLNVLRPVRPGNPASSFLLGATFALGWVPCIGPVLGSIFTLAATSTGAKAGAILLAIYSLGLAIPFLIIAGTIGMVSPLLVRFSPWLHTVTIVGGAFFVFLGFLLVTGYYGHWNTFVYRIFDFIDYGRLLNYL